MNEFLIAALLSLMCFSPLPEAEPRSIAAQFTIYVDDNALAEGELKLSLETMVDNKVYFSDCFALYDLCKLQEEVCDYQEMFKLNEILKAFENLNNTEDYKENINKL
jgi:hypothetical protein